MKKWNGLLILLLLLAAAPVGAQTFWVGARGGINFANWSGDDLPAVTSRTLPQGALFGAYPIAPWLAVESEIALTQKGTAYRYDRLNREQYALSYIEVPLLARLQLPLLDGLLVPHALIGPSAAVRVGCGVSGLFQGFSFDVACDHPALGDNIRMKRLDLGLMVGGGVDIGVPGGIMTVDARYDHGLTDIDEDDRGAPVYNRVVSVVIGFARPLER